MAPKDRGTTVYSTGAPLVCPTCREPRPSCRCGRPATPREPVPARPVAKLRVETKGRGGKSVTVVDGLPRNEEFVAELAAALKKSLGTGGAVRAGAVELQGDCRDRARPLLETRGFRVKG